jgi:hypothetical protein
MPALYKLSPYKIIFFILSFIFATISPFVIAFTTANDECDNFLLASLFSMMGLTIWFIIVALSKTHEYSLFCKKIKFENPCDKCEGPKEKIDSKYCNECFIERKELDEKYINELKFQFKEIKLTIEAMEKKYQQ